MQDAVQIPNELNGFWHDVLPGKTKGIDYSLIFGQSSLELNTELRG